MIPIVTIATERIKSPKIHLYLDDLIFDFDITTSGKVIDISIQTMASINVHCRIVFNGFFSTRIEQSFPRHSNSTNNQQTIKHPNHGHCVYNSFQSKMMIIICNKSKQHWSITDTDPTVCSFRMSLTNQKTWNGNLNGRGGTLI